MVNQKTINRLTALWALSECGLGGFMHAVKLPFTGILVGGVSILMISLIAYYSTSPWKTILKSLLIVLIIKTTVSPHSPIPAYFAVTFQGVLGGIIYSFKSIKQIAPILLGALTFFESATQKIITLTLIFGQTLWSSIDIYSKWITKKMGVFEQLLSAEGLILFFISIYVICGILAGFIIKKVMRSVSSYTLETPLTFDFTTEELSAEKKRKKKWLPKKVFFWLWVALFSILPLLFWNDQNGIKKGIYFVARSLLVLMTWYFIVSPFILRILKKHLSSKKQQYKVDVNTALDIFPYLKSIIKHAWKASKNQPKHKRISEFLTLVIVHSIHFNPPEK